MNDAHWMTLALDQARLAAKAEEVPVGAVIVCDDQLVASAHNEVEALSQADAHAEALALRRAAEVLGDWRLDQCTLYVTLEPCLMCAGALGRYRIGRVVYGAPDPKAGALGTLYQVNSDERLNWRFEVEAGVLAEESVKLLQDYFQKLRSSD